MPHHLLCEASICSGDPNHDFKKEVVWYPGESVCKKSPYEKFQKVQLRINRLVAKGKFKNLDTYFTANMLEKMQIVRPGTKGKNPDQAVA